VASSLGLRSLTMRHNSSNTSVVQGKDIIYVAANYRVDAFGFMPGKEVLADGSANLVLLDQRLALQVRRFPCSLILGPLSHSP
jgi:carboxylesterase type B